MLGQTTSECQSGGFCRVCSACLPLFCRCCAVSWTGAEVPNRDGFGALRAHTTHHTTPHHAPHAQTRATTCETQNSHNIITFFSQKLTTFSATYHISHNSHTILAKLSYLKFSHNSHTIPTTFLRLKFSQNSRIILTQLFSHLKFSQN